jgi:hypothetical protein
VEAYLNATKDFSVPAQDILSLVYQRLWYVFFPSQMQNSPKEYHLQLIARAVLANCDRM